MPKVILELTESEARIVVRALNVATNCFTIDGTVFDFKSTEAFDITEADFEAFRPKLQACRDEFNRNLNKWPGIDEVPLRPIPWPPTDVDIVNFLIDTLCLQLPETKPEDDEDHAL